MKRRIFEMGIVLVVLAAALTASAGASPVGVWKTVDDQTGEARSHIQIWEHKGILYGKIIKLINPSEPNPLCDKCTGKKKDQPVLGMTIMWGLKSDEDSEWSDGHIMDPENGKTYGCKITIEKDGKILKVRGFIGFSLLGRTQVWHRIK